jgi:hypothetical protein
VYPSPSIITMTDSRSIKWERHVARMVGTPEGKRPLGTHRHTWEHNISRNIMTVSFLLRLSQRNSGQ